MGPVGGRANGWAGRILGWWKGARQLEKAKDGRLSATFTPKWLTKRGSDDIFGNKVTPVHYGAVIVATQGISVFLPPVGVSLLVACSVGGVEPAEVARPLWPYLALMLGLTVST